MAYRDRYELEPLRIRATLRTPVIADRWLPLDGLLLYQTHRDQCGPQVQTLPGEYSSQMKIATLPLGISNPGRRIWYYQCSWAQWSNEVEGREHWNKRFDSKLADLVDFGKRRGKVIIEQGRYKAYHMPIFYRAALWIEWYCMGDKAGIEYHLSTMTHIGKKTSQGWGRVIRWEVEPWPEDWSVWRDGQLMRGVPVEEFAKHGWVFPVGTNITNYGVRPSYWKRNNQIMLAMPDG